MLNLTGFLDYVLVHLPRLITMPETGSRTFL
jgi:hypothetical protein